MQTLFFREVARTCSTSWGASLRNRFVVGVLMVCVLAVGVQGVAEAITKFTKTSSTDNQIVSIQQPFTIRFSVSLQGNKRIPDTAGTGYIDQDNDVIDSDGYFLDANGFYKNAAGASIDSSGYLLDSDGLRQNANGASIDSSGYLLDSDGLRQNANGDAIDSSGYLLDSNGDRTVPHTKATTGTNPTTQVKATTGTNPTTQVKAVDTVKTKTTPLKQYHFNEESISIAHSGVSGGSITFTNGSTEVSSLSENAEERDERLSSSISLNCRADMAGVYTITIADSTLSGDTPSAHSNVSPAMTFTITVLQAVATSRALTFTAEGRLSDNIVGEFGAESLSVTVSGATENARVEFEITKGPGSLSAENTIGSKTSKRLSTLTNASGVATVTLDPKKGTNHVRAWIYGNSPGVTDKSTEGIYIYQWAILTKVSGDSGEPNDPEKNQKGPVSSRLEEPFVVQLFDSTGRTTIPGADITFTATATPPGSLRYDPSTPSSLRGVALASDATTATVKTDSNGKASIFLVLGTDVAADYTVTAAYSLFDTKTFTATSFASTVTSKAHSIRKVASTDGQSANQYGELEKPLTVVVRDQGGRRLAHTDTTSVIVTFLTLNGGDLITPTDSEPGTLSDETGALDKDRAKDIETDVNGEASVGYTAPEEGGRRTVRASINNGLKSVIFTINGPAVSGGSGGSGNGGDPDPEPIITRTLDIDVSDSGSTRTVEVTALRNGLSQRGISIDLTVSGAATLSKTSGGTPLESTLTLPAGAGEYTLRASTTASGYSAVEEEIEVTVPGRLAITLEGEQVNGAQTIVVTARNAAGILETTRVTVTLSGAGISRTVDVTGSRRVPIPLPTTSARLTAKATGYNPGTVELPARTTTPTTGEQQQQQQQQQTVGGTADSIEIDGSRTIDGTVNQSTRLRARVLDANDRGVSDARVTFRILAPGKGRLSQRGNGRAISVETDRSGYATATLIPLGGDLIVEAKAAGVTARVSFIIEVGEGTTPTGTSDTAGARTYQVGDKIPVSLEDTLSFTGSRTLSGTTYRCVGPGACVISYGLVTKGEIQVPPAKTTTPGTSDTPRTTEIKPVVQVNASNRPPMLWVDGGAIYALVGADVQRFAPSVDNAMNIAVDASNNKVYWTEKTGESGGTINSANLNGTGVTELASIFATPIGIAVDAAGSKLYWTNSAGRIQSANLNGSGIQNVLQNLDNPMDLALAGGNAYWTQGNGSVRFVNLRGQKVVRNISTGLDTPGSLVIGGGKVYWTEMTGESGGTINSANLNGSGAMELASILAAPSGIAVDGSRSKLYWTNARGRIQSANLDGSGITNVVSGLGSPGELVLSNSIATPTPTITTTTTTPTRSKYDVNSDGSVDNTDASLVAAAMNTSNTKYDVNGDGTVNFLDLLLVFDNRDPGAAGAPTIVGMKLSAAQIDGIEEQIDLLIATGDRSPAAMRTLIYLQQLLVTARPEKTQLLANYPNPFNPETWIPYELATDTHVEITIYNPQGVVIRRLQLGQQSAGYYTDRDRAAYWDGRNALGEQVASGLYFYQFETDEMSSMRKMVILK